MCKESVGLGLFSPAFEPPPGLFGPSGRTTASTRVQPPALQLFQRLEQVNPQRRPCHQRLRLGRPKVAFPIQMESSLHRPKALLDLVAKRGNRPFHLRLQGMHRFAPAALELDQVTDILALEVLPVGRTGVPFVSQHCLRLDALRSQCIHDARQFVDLGLIGRVHLDVLDIAVFRVHRAVTPIRLRTARIAGLPLVQPLELVRDLISLHQLVQLHRRRVLHQRLGTQQKKTVHALIEHQSQPPRIREVMQLSRAAKG